MHVFLGLFILIVLFVKECPPLWHSFVTTRKKLLEADSCFCKVILLISHSCYEELKVASSRRSVSWDSAQKTAWKKWKKHGERKRKNACEQTLQRIIPPNYRLPMETSNMTAGLWFWVVNPIFQTLSLENQLTLCKNCCLHITLFFLFKLASLTSFLRQHILQ